MWLSPEEFISNRIRIKFYEEEGYDYEGFTREWLQLVINKLTSPETGLFIQTTDSEVFLIPSILSYKNEAYLLYFRFLGRILAKIILDRCNVKLDLDRTVYKYLLGKKVELSDLKLSDPVLYNSFVGMKDNKIDESSIIRFKYEYKDAGEFKSVDLKDNGSDITVTDSNKEEYINLYINYKYLISIEPQLDSIREGLYEIIDEKDLLVFNESELEMIICGKQDIDVDDWERYTVNSDYNKDSEVVLWFWKAVRSFTSTEKTRLLKFCTGSERLPRRGFFDLICKNEICRFEVKKASSDNNSLPTSRRCFNSINLPEYSSYEVLRSKLLLAINEGHEVSGDV